jgi:hypothetical protein
MSVLKEFIVKDMPQLPVDHPLHYLENLIKRELLSKKQVHDEEHVDMLKHWNIGDNIDQAGKLTIRKDENDTPYADRMWHIALHMRYWKEKGMHTKHVEEFEQKSGISLEHIQLPEAKDNFGGY